ncbi:hypothetical protein ACYU03_07880 [Pseudomonas sp. X10]
MEQYVQYLKMRPRTFDWGALLVYDRFKTNRLLAQEHVENLDLGKWMPLITFRKESDGLTTTVSDLQLDRPVLSFVNSNLGASRARLSMNVISGLIVQTRRQPGSDQDELVSYSNLDLLTAPAVRMDIYLNESNQGNVNDAGRVTLDLSKGESYKFEVSTWRDLNEKLGQAIADELRGWNEEDQVWELNVLKPIEGQLNPTAFEVRTHSYARAQQISNASEEEQEEGAVIVGVAFDGKAGGSFPGQDSAMPYLLPSPTHDPEKPYTLNLIYSNEVWLKDTLSEVVEKILSLQNIKVERNHYGFYGDVTGDLDLSIPGREDRTAREYDTFDVYSFKWPDLNLNSSFNIRHDDDMLNYDFAVATESQRYVVQFMHPDGVKVMRPNGEISVKIKGGLQFKLAEESSRKGELDIVVHPATVEYNTAFSGSEYSYYDSYTKRAAEDYVMAEVRKKVEAFVSQFTSLSEITIPFNLLRLNGLLFRGTDVTTPRSLLLPGDLSLLGDLAPKLTTFAIEPLESVVSAGTGETVELRLDPEPNGPVDWQVKPLKGESENAGTIANGVYTPPAVSSISGTQKRVIVTATADGSSSSALITVVPNSVSIYPYFLIAQYDSSKPEELPPRYVLVGGDINNELTWSMVGGSKGSQRLPEEGDSDLDIPKDKNVRVYVSPKRAPGEGGEVEALVHLDRVQVSAGGLTQWIDVIVPWTTATAKIKSHQISEGGWQLAVAYDSAETGEEEELGPEFTKWAVLLGTGEIDPATGIYQPGESEGPYIIVAGRETPPERIATWGFKVILLSSTAKHAVALGAPFKKEV